MGYHYYPITRTVVDWRCRIPKSDTTGELELRHILDGLGLRFTSQVSIPLQELEAGTIADFLIPSLHLIVYVDGPHHKGRRKTWDEQVDQALTAKGYRVLRIPDHILHRDSQFIQQIFNLLIQLTLGQAQIQQTNNDGGEDSP